MNMAPSADVGKALAFSSPHTEIPPTLQGANDCLSGAVTIWPLVGGGGGDAEDNDGDDKRKEGGGTATGRSRSKIVDGVGIAELYASLRQGQSVKQWYVRNSDKLANIDIRRFITFGIIKGFLYRVHKYAYETGHRAPTHVESSKTITINAAAKVIHGDNYNRGHNNNTYNASSVGEANYGSYIDNHNGSNGSNSPPLHMSRRPETPEPAASSYRSGFHYGYHAHDSFEQSNDGEVEDFVDEKTLSKYLDGMHCFDQICTELEMSEKELTARLKRHPWEVLIIHR